MLNMLWGGLMLISLIWGSLNGTLSAVGNGAMEGAASGVSLCVVLLGAYALWMGILRLAQRCGMTVALSKALRKPLRLLFPELTPDDPVWEPLTTNIAANFLGMGGAATPKGLETMQLLQKNNKDPTRATHAMCLFLVLNVSAIQLLPTTIIAMRAACGSANPAEILFPALLSTIISAICGLALAKVLGRVM